MNNNNMQNSSISCINPAQIRINQVSSGQALSACGQSALDFLDFGFKVIPIIPVAKQTAVKWDAWLDGLSSAKVNTYWSAHPEHEVGFIVGDNIIVFDADSPESIVALAMLEQSFDLTPNMVVKTAKGEHHYFKRAEGTFAKSDSHSTQEHPDRLDVKTGRSMVILPPSTGKTLDIDEATNAGDLVEVSQSFIDAVFRHNGRPEPRLFVSVPTQAVVSKSSNQQIKRVEALLECLNPDSGYDNWINGGMAIFNESAGSDEGLEVFDSWSRRGKKYPGRSEIEAKWRSFKSYQGNPITIATLAKMVQDNGIDCLTICDAADPQFELCETTTIYPEYVGERGTKQVEVAMINNEPNQAVLHTVQPAIEIKKPANPLDRYSLRGRSAEIEKSVVESVQILGELALLGQATVLYAAPNTGKTLIALSLLTDAVKEGRVDPSNVYYLNMDDSGQGLLEKVRIAEEYGFHMLAEGYSEFSASEFLSIVRGLIENDQASGVVIVLDTLKKFTDLMDKGRTSTFTNVIRPFVLKGGTVIALAHTNKNPGKDGKLQYAGVSDIMNDFDCAYIIAPVSDQDGHKFVEFTNTKRRGNVVQNAAYSYCIGNKIQYNEILLSVRSVDLNALAPLKQVEAIKSDFEVIAAITTCIKEGVHTKMKLADAVATRSGISKRSALQIIDKYTGKDQALHRWSFSVGERGAKMFALLDSAT